MTKRCGHTVYESIRHYRQIPIVSSVPTVGLDADTLAWVAEVVSNGGSVSAGRKIIVDELILGLKADGLWTNLDRLWLHAGENAPSALTDIVALALATTVSAPTFTVDRGYTGNGSSSYINTLYNPTSGSPVYALNSAHMGIYTLTQPGATAHLCAINNAGGTESGIRVTATPSEVVQINSNTASAAPIQSAGMQIGTRTASGVAVLYNNRIAIATDTTSTSTLVPNLNFPVLARNVAPSTIDSFSDVQVAASCFGGGVSATEAANLSSRINTYMIAVGAQDFDADTLAWATAVGANGGTVSGTRKGLVDDLIAGLKADGIWTKLDRLWLHAGEDAPSALTDIVADSLATNVNSVSFTADRGFTGNGSTSYIGTNYNPSGGGFNYIQDSACLFVWINTSGNEAVGCIGQAPNKSVIYPKYTDNNEYFAVNASFENYPASTSLGNVGLYSADRSAAANVDAYKDGANVGNSTGVSASVEAVDFRVCGDTGPEFSVRQICASGMGGHLSSTEQANLYSRLRTYMTAVGVP